MFIFFLILFFGQSLFANTFLGFFWPKAQKGLSLKEKREIAFLLASYENNSKNLLVVEFLYPKKKEKKALILKKWLLKEIQQSKWSPENFYVTTRILPIKKIQVNFYQKPKDEISQRSKTYWPEIIVALIILVGCIIFCRRYLFAKRIP